MFIQRALKPVAELSTTVVDISSTTVVDISSCTLVDNWCVLATRSAKRTSAAEQKREQRTHAAPKKQLLSLLSSYPPHQLTHLQQTSPMLSSTT